MLDTEHKIKFTEEYIIAHADTVDWDEAAFYIEPSTFSMKFFFDFEENINWGHIFLNKKYDLVFLKLFTHKISALTYPFIFSNKHVREDIFYFLLERKVHNEKLMFDILSHSSCLFNLSSAFIIANKDKIAWEKTSTLKELPVSFMKRYRKFLHWKTILINLDLDDELLEEFREDINWEKLISESSLGKNFLIKYKKQIGVENILAHQFHVSRKDLE